MARLRRCDELITEFRMRIGEPTPGTFGTVYYDGINENVHEIRSILNQSQEHVTWMCYSANQALLESTVYLEVLSGVSRYTLPDDFLGPVSVFHRTYGQEYEVERANLMQIRASTRSERSDYRYRFYEVREAVPIIAARGVIQADHKDEITATGLEAVRVGDIVYNLTDNSQGVVNAIFPNIMRIKVDTLTDGSVNRFQEGDIYQIDMQEATRDSIDFYPTVSREDSELGYKGSPTGWHLMQDSVVLHLQASISELPRDFEEDERVVVKIMDGTTEVAEGAREGLQVNANEFYFPNFVQLREDVDYDVVVERADSGDVVAVDSIEVTVKKDPESIEVRYAKLPRPMETLESYCEVPSWAIEAVYAYAHIIAQKKMSRNPNADRGLVAEFNNEIENIKRHLYKRDERGPHSAPILGGNRVSGGFPYPSNYSIGFVDPFDLF